MAGPNLRSALITSAVTAGVSLSAGVPTGWVGQTRSAPLAFAGVAGFSLIRHSDAHKGPATSVLTVLIATLAAAVAIEELLFKWSWSTGGGASPRQHDETGDQSSRSRESRS